MKSAVIQRQMQSHRSATGILCFTIFLITEIDMGSTMQISLPFNKSIQKFGYRDLRKKASDHKQGSKQVSSFDVEYLVDTAEIAWPKQSILLGADFSKIFYFNWSCIIDSYIKIEMRLVSSVILLLLCATTSFSWFNLLSLFNIMKFTPTNTPPGRPWKGPVGIGAWHGVTTPKQEKKGPVTQQKSENLIQQKQFGGYLQKGRIAGRNIFTVAPENLLPIGDFSGANQLSSWQNVNAGIKEGSGYHSMWGNTSVVSLQALQVIHLLLSLPEGLYLAAFDWAPRQGNPPKQSQFEIKWNGKLFTKMHAVQDTILSQEVLLRSSDSENRLTFMGAGSSKFQITISNVRVFRVVNAHQPYQTLPFRLYGFKMLEGYVQKNIIKHIGFVKLNIGKEQRSKDDLLRSGEINIKTYLNYYSDINPTQNIELVSNTEYFGEYSDTTNKKYVIHFDYAPRAGQALQNSQFSVLLDNQLALRLSPSTYQIRRQFLVRSGRNIDSVIGISFRGEGSSIVYITNVNVHVAI